MSSANQSVRSAEDQTPALFTQPARLVLELTSGLTVTILAPTCGAARLTSSSARPSADCVVAVPDGVRPRSAGTGGGSVQAERGHAAPVRRLAAHSAASAEPSGNRSHG